LKEAVNIFSPIAKSRKNQSIKDAPILYIIFFGTDVSKLKFKNEYVDTPTIIGNCSYCQPQCSYSEKAG